jgi:xylulokinase
VATRYLIGIDIGTSSLKTGLWREDGVLVARAAYDYSVYRPSPIAAEMNALDWWAAACATVRAVLNESKIDPAAVAGVGVDGLGWSPVLVDEHDTPVFPSLIWLDRQSDAEARALQASPDAAYLVDLVANPLDPAYITSKLIWLRKREPDLYRRVRMIYTSSGFIVRKLTGVAVCDYTQAYGFHCFDIRRECWDERASDLLGIDLGLLPPLLPSNAVAGTVTSQAARATGLAVGTPVIAGALDAAVGAFGTGIVRAGQTADQGGTAFGMSICTDHVVVEPRLIFSHHVVPGLYLLQGGTVGGGMFNWYRDTLGQAEQVAAAALGSDAYALMNREAELSPPGARGLVFLPYMAGERSPLWNSNARGVFFGMSYASTRGDLLRAIMEGCAFAVYHNLVVAAEAGADFSELIGFGGAAGSALWCEIKADISGRTFSVLRRADGEQGDNTLGLAVMVGAAVGIYPDMGRAIENFLPLRTVYTPDPARHALYQDIFAVYLDLSERLTAPFEQLARLGMTYESVWKK